MPEGFREPRTEKSKRILIITSSLLGIIILLVLIIKLLNINSENKADNLEQQLTEFTEELNKISETVNTDQLANIINHLNQHLHWSKIFPEIERSTLSGVQFSRFSSNVGEEAEIIIALTGRANNFNTLAKQVVAFQDNPIFEQVNFSSSGISKDGGIGISIELTINKSALWK